MLVQLLPEQVEEGWDYLGDSIGDSLPPMVAESEKAMSNILTALLTGDATAWVYFVGNTTEGKPRALVVTTFYRDPLTRSKHLLIYSLYMLDQMRKEMATDALETLVKYARGEDCHSIIAYTANEELKHLADKFGAETRFSLIEFNL